MTTHVKSSLCKEGNDLGNVTFKLCACSPEDKDKVKIEMKVRICEICEIWKMPIGEIWHLRGCSGHGRCLGMVVEVDSGKGENRMGIGKTWLQCYKHAFGL